jgi:hypothetical protein
MARAPGSPMAHSGSLKSEMRLEEEEKEEEEEERSRCCCCCHFFYFLRCNCFLVVVRSPGFVQSVRCSLMV